MDLDKLREIIAEDEFGLLDAPEKAPALTEDERLADSFQEILDFVAANGREPTEDVANMAEATLAWRLKAIRGDASQIAVLESIDTAGLLDVADEPPSSLAELFESDDLGILDTSEAEHILDESNLPEQHASPEKVAESKPAEDFEKFEPMFEKVHAELKAGVRTLTVAAKEENIREGAFFVVRGMLCYIDHVGEAETGNYGRTAERVRVIYDNGTESDPQRRSFQRALHRYGKAVTEPALIEREELAVDPDAPIGSVYVLRSLSDDPKIRNIPFLHKIGFTDGSVEKRIANAEESITYLKAPVEVVAVYEVPGAGARALEKMLHTVFDEARLDAGFERNGVRVGDATEWFSVPRNRIDEAVRMIQSGVIVNYSYDPENLVFVITG